MFSVDAAVNYFVQKRYGFRSLAYPAMASMDKDKTSENHKKLAEFEAFKNELKAMPVNELEQLYNQTKAQDTLQEKLKAVKDEKAQFYNQPYANADFVHWSKAAHWTLDEAVALSFGKEPDQVNWEKLEPLKDKSTFAKNFAKRRDLALRATHWKRFGNTIPPAVFIDWAKELKIELPEALLNAVSEMGMVAVNWHEKFLKLKAEFDTRQKQPSENTQKTDNLLKAIACIAFDAYGYDPKSAKSTVAKDISEALKKHGQSMDPKTIRAWLKNGIELLPRKPL
jgi:hypothetical protein